jgi:hypothetical protein
MALATSLLLFCGPPPEPPVDPSVRSSESLSPSGARVDALTDAEVYEGYEAGSPSAPEAVDASDLGDATARPCRGGLCPEQIRRVVIAHRGALQACYEIYSRKGPSLQGGVTIVWSIDASGVVTSASVAGSTIQNESVESCVLRQVLSWHFPSSHGKSEVKFPFSFGTHHPGDSRGGP